MLIGNVVSPICALFGQSWYRQNYKVLPVATSSFYECENDTHGEYDQSRTTHLW